MFTDHKPVVSALTRTTPPVSARQQRHLSYISEFAVNLVHLPGAANCAADAMSRPSSSTSPPVQPPKVVRAGSPATGTTAVAAVSSLPPTVVAAVSTPLSSRAERAGSPATGSATVSSSDGELHKGPSANFSMDDLAAAQKSCSDCQTLAASSKFQVESDHHGVMVSLANKPCILLPTIYRRRAFDEVHNLAHPGTRATKRMMSDRFLWPGMAKDITAWVKCCLDCQRSKIHRHTKSPIVEIPIPVCRFDHLHIDLVGELHESGESSNLLTIVDRRTRWPEAIPLVDTTASTCIAALTTHWFSRFGIPAIVTTDRGPQFTSAAWDSAMVFFGIKHVKTTAYHPQSNGMVERLHRRLKDAL